MLKNYLGNLDPPTPEPESLFKFSMTFLELLSAGAHYHTLFWGKRLLLTGSCIFLFLLTSFSLFPVTAPTGVARQQTEASPFIHKTTRYQIVQEQNQNLPAGSKVRKEDKEKEEAEIKPWWEDSLHLSVVPVSHR